MKTGEWIRTGRARLGYSRERLSEHVDCSVAALKAWEADIRPPSVRYMDPLVSLLGMPPDLEYRRVKFDGSTPRRQAKA